MLNRTCGIIPMDRRPVQGILQALMHYLQTGGGLQPCCMPLLEGLCGVEDMDNGFGKVRCTPRWLIAGEDEARVELTYPASGISFGYQYTHDPRSPCHSPGCEILRLPKPLFDSYFLRILKLPPFIGTGAK